MDVSVIIVNYNTKKLCRDCIDSVIEKTEGLKYEIIVVDNNSSDNSAEYLKDVYSDKVKIITSDVNLGFGRANNLGFRYAVGKYVFLLNSDTVLINNAIKILFDFIDSNEDVGVVGGNLYNLNGKGMHSYMREMPSLKNDRVPNIFTRLWRRLRFDKNGREFNADGVIKPVGYITGADMMIRMSALNSAGWFDEEFFMYSEEVELTHRIRKLGYKVYSVPQAKIIHLEGASSGAKNTLNKFKEVNRLNGKCLYYEKVYGKEAVLPCLKITKFQNLRLILHDIILMRSKRLQSDLYKYKLAKDYYRQVKEGKEPYRG